VGDERSNIQLSTVCHVPQDVDPLPDVDVSGIHVDFPVVVLASPIWTTATNNGFTAQAEAETELRQLKIVTVLTSESGGVPESCVHVVLHQTSTVCPSVVIADAIGVADQHGAGGDAPINGDEPVDARRKLNRTYWTAAWLALSAAAWNCCASWNFAVRRTSLPAQPTVAMMTTLTTTRKIRARSREAPSSPFPTPDCQRRVDWRYLDAI
jgi:hypothetical protein